MAQKKKAKKRNPIQAVLPIALVLLVVVILVVTLGGKKKTTAEEAAIQNGLDFLTQQEQKSPEPIRQVRQALYERRMQEKKEQMITELSNGGDPFSLYQDYALLGDSRAVGFYFWDFLPEERVLAEAGNTILAIEDRHEALKELKPSYVFLCYGLNDCGIGIWETGEEYAADYMEEVRKLQELLPGVTIIVSSILPAQDPAFEQSTAWYDIPDWNEALKSACEAEGILYADCDWLHEKHSDLWEIDGIHFLSTFYPYWGSDLIVTALYGGMTDET